MELSTPKAVNPSTNKTPEAQGTSVGSSTIIFFYSLQKETHFNVGEDWDLATLKKLSSRMAATQLNNLRYRVIRACLHLVYVIVNL